MPETPLPTDYETRRLSFGANAEDYARFRPGYPSAAVRWMLSDRADLRVVDLGAGTGAFTRVLVAQGHDVIAVEPDPGMLATLRAELPGVDARAGSAERVPLEDHSVDAVLAAQAWHWFDPEDAPIELARVLRPAGTVGLVWNIRDDERGWMADLHEIVGGEDSIRARRGPGALETALGEQFTPWIRPISPTRCGTPRTAWSAWSRRSPTYGHVRTPRRCTARSAS